jgi:hypothetical protein
MRGKVPWQPTREVSTCTVGSKEKGMISINIDNMDILLISVYPHSALSGPWYGTYGRYLLCTGISYVGDLLLGRIRILHCTSGVP